MRSQSDDFVCGNSEDFPEDIAGNYSASTVLDLQNLPPVVFNIAFWKINPVSGINDNDFTEEIALEMVAELNILYNTINVFFKFRGFDEFDSVHYDESSLAEVKAFADANGYVNPNAFNVYVPWRYELSNGNGYCGQGFYNSTTLGLNSQCITGPRIIHEVGHNFVLIHTHSGWSGTACEKVTRDPNDLNCNADIRGDKVVDTNAVPNFRREYCIDNNIPSEDCEPYFYYYLDPTTCTYSNPNGDDCQQPVGTPYTISENDVRNYMAYTLADCRNVFTDGQGVRVRETIANDLGGAFSAATTTIESLYEAL